MLYICIRVFHLGYRGGICTHIYVYVFIHIYMRVYRDTQDLGGREALTDPLRELRNTAVSNKH